MVRDHERFHAKLDDEELTRAGWEAAKGAGKGAALYGLYGGIFGLGSYRLSPVYRGLTVQFKVFIQMSFMTLGAVLEGERRMRLHELHMRREKRARRDTELWRRYEEDFEDRGTPGVGGEGRVKGD